ncbi:hypothetical protein HRbin17_00547 [bacterium HR17]|jgi:hypothetical protein|uniref:Uncharacterized protein n=1 Tax=Candidatus Fervidibacter japonicus TaxID=2035412 RepID=A0A2H5XA36_9BACT|nr:hypothetical protein HRbin17_00547 [bacterium HR17]
MAVFFVSLLLVALIVYAGYFAWLNALVASFDPKSKMVVLYFWKDMTALSAWGLSDLALRVRLWELVLFVAAGATLLGIVVGWRLGRRGAREREEALRRSQTELHHARQQINQLQGQLLEAYRQHELRLAELTEKVLALTKAALPTAELQVERLPLMDAPHLSEGNPPNEQP